MKYLFSGRYETNIILLTADEFFSIWHEQILRLGTQWKKWEFYSHDYSPGDVSETFEIHGQNELDFAGHGNF